MFSSSSRGNLLGNFWTHMLRSSSSSVSWNTRLLSCAWSVRPRRVPTIAPATDGLSHHREGGEAIFGWRGRKGEGEERITSNSRTLPTLPCSVNHPRRRATTQQRLGVYPSSCTRMLLERATHRGGCRCISTGGVSKNQPDFKRGYRNTMGFLVLSRRSSRCTLSGSCRFRQLVKTPHLQKGHRNLTDRRQLLQRDRLLYGRADSGVGLVYLGSVTPVQYTT